jgi:hypothetical protein
MFQSDGEKFFANIRKIQTELNAFLRRLSSVPDPAAVSGNATDPLSEVKRGRLQRPILNFAPRGKL